MNLQKSVSIIEVNKMFLIRTAAIVLMLSLTVPVSHARLVLEPSKDANVDSTEISQSESEIDSEAVRSGSDRNHDNPDSFGVYSSNNSSKGFSQRSKIHNLKDSDAMGSDQPVDAIDAAEKVAKPRGKYRAKFMQEWEIDITDEHLIPALPSITQSSMPLTRAMVYPQDGSGGKDGFSSSETVNQGRLKEYQDINSRINRRLMEYEAIRNESRGRKLVNAPAPNASASSQGSRLRDQY